MQHRQARAGCSPPLIIAPSGFLSGTGHHQLGRLRLFANKERILQRESGPRSRGRGADRLQHVFGKYVGDEV